MVKIRHLGRALLGLAALFAVSSTPASADLGDAIEHTNWNVVKISSSHNDGQSATTLAGQKAYIIDGDVSTYWHSNWDNTQTDATATGANFGFKDATVTTEYFVIDLGEDVTGIGGFGYQPRQAIDANSGYIANGAATSWKVYVLTASDYATLSSSIPDLATTKAEEETVVSLTIPTTSYSVSGTFTYAFNSTSDITEQMYAFGQSVSGRYVVFVINGSSESPLAYCGNCAEFNLYNYADTDNAKYKQVTYKVLDGTSTLATATKWHTIGDAPAIPVAAKRDLCSYTYDAETIATSTETVNVNVTYTLPFTLTSSNTSTTIDLATAKWHTVGIRTPATRFLNYTASNSTGITGQNFSTYQLPTTANLFAFTGNPYTGFRIYNYDAGTDMAYYKAITATTYSDNQTDVAMTSISSTNDFDNGGTWNLRTYNSNYYFLQNGTTNGVIHDLSSGYQIWSSTYWAPRDAGSYVTFTEVTLDEIARCAEATTAINNSDASNTTTCITAASTYLGTTTTAPSIDDAFNAFKASMTAENLTALKTATNGFAEARTALETELASKYYTIQNASTAYLSVKSGDYNTNAFGNKVTTVSPNEIWQFVPCENGFKLKHPNLGYYLNSLVGGGSNTTGISSDYTNGGKYVLGTNSDNTTKLQNGLYYQCISYEAGTEANTGNINSWYNENSGDTNASWTIAEVSTIELALNTVGEASYATTYLPFAVSSVSGAAPYIGAYNDDKTEINATATDGTIPANTGVILVGAKDATSATLTIGTGTAVTGNELMGTCVAITNSNYLTFGRIKGQESSATEPAFYLYTGTTIPANKVYLDKAVASTIRLNFGGDVTGIDAATIFGGESNAPVYDLSGRRVATPVKGGIYLQGGKKFIK